MWQKLHVAGHFLDQNSLGCFPLNLIFIILRERNAMEVDYRDAIMH